MKACEGLCNHQESSFSIPGWVNKGWRRKDKAEGSLYETGDQELETGRNSG
jgi:hypothetical protein